MGAARHGRSARGPIRSAADAHADELAYHFAGRKRGAAAKGCASRFGRGAMPWRATRTGAADYLSAALQQHDRAHEAPEWDAIRGYRRGRGGGESCTGSTTIGGVRRGVGTLDACAWTAEQTGNGRPPSPHRASSGAASTGVPLSRRRSQHFDVALDAAVRAVETTRACPGGVARAMTLQPWAVLDGARSEVAAALAIAELLGDGGSWHACIVHRCCYTSSSGHRSTPTRRAGEPSRSPSRRGSAASMVGALGHAMVGGLSGNARP